VTSGQRRGGLRAMAIPETMLSFADEVIE